LKGPTVQTKDATEATETAVPMVVFCIDISASMQAAVDVGTGVTLPTGERTSHVSRLQCVKAAVHAQIDMLRRTCPACVPVIITFGSTVTVFGGHDGSRGVALPSGRLMSDLDALELRGEKDLGPRCNVSVGGTFGCADQLLRKVRDLRTAGCTALGPALATAVGIAGSCQAAGAKIVVCTDGMANTGVGAIQRDQPCPFYTEVAKRALAKGVSISVVTMEGEDCSMENLGTAADISGGQVEIVDPLDLSTKVEAILQRRTLATNAELLVLAGDGIVLNNMEGSAEPLSAAADDDASLEEGKAEKRKVDGFKNKFHALASGMEHCKVVTRMVGNITRDTDLCFGFLFEDCALRAIAANEKTREQQRQAQGQEGLPLGQVKVQVQLRYTKPDGEQRLLVRTLALPITVNREEAEADIDATVLALHTIQGAARLAQMGRYPDARVSQISAQRLLQRAMYTEAHQQAYLSYIVQAEKLDQFMREAEMQEKVFGTSKCRPKTRDDEASKAMYQMKNVCRTAFFARE